MQVNVHEAKTQMSRLIGAALRGEEVVIARNSHPVVRMVPVVKSGFRMVVLQGALNDLPDFLEPMPEEELCLWEGTASR